MCLGIPGKIIEVDKEKMYASVDSGGVKSKIAIGLVPDVKPGDYVMIHAGCAVDIIDQEEAQERLHIWKELLSYENNN